MDKFGEYMFYLLSTPFKQADKKKNQWYIFFKTVGSCLTRIKQLSRPHGKKAW